MAQDTVAVLGVRVRQIAGDVIDRAAVVVVGDGVEQRRRAIRLGGIAREGRHQQRDGGGNRLAGCRLIDAELVADLGQRTGAGELLYERISHRCHLCDSYPSPE